jgi:hypothetical protein
MRISTACSNQQKCGILSLGDDWRQQYPEAQHICEQLEISISDMSAAFANGGWQITASPSIYSALES